MNVTSIRHVAPLHARLLITRLLSGLTSVPFPQSYTHLQDFRS